MKKYLILIAIMLLLPVTANAANANIDITASPSKASVGNKINVSVNVNSTTPIGYYEYTLNYDHEKLELVSGKSYIIEYANTDNTKSFKKSFTFKIKSKGSNKISVKSYAVSAASNNESMSVTVNPANINSSGNETISPSDNNNLSSLKIENYKIEPTFNKNTTNYVLKIEDDIDEINVIAKAENSKASVVGNGKHKLKKGDNRIEVTVTSENGQDKTYTIKVRLTEKKQIIVTIDGKNYTVIKKLDRLKAENYKTTNIILQENSIEALYNSNTNLTLIGLKDIYEKENLYIYDIESETYYPYIELKYNNTIIVPIKTDEKLKNYNKYTETIEENEIECYKISESSNYCNIYAINNDSGETKWYTYNIDDKTIEEYNESIDNNTEKNKKNNNSNTLIYILSGSTILFGILTIVFAIKSGKRKK